MTALNMDALELNSKPSQSKSMSKSAKFLIFATGGVGIGLSVVCASFVAPAFRRICLPYVPATPEQVSNVLKFLPSKGPKRLLDIGSGDGRIVIGMYWWLCLHNPETRPSIQTNTYQPLIITITLSHCQTWHSVGWRRA